MKKEIKLIKLGIREGKLINKIAQNQQKDVEKNKGSNIQPDWRIKKRENKPTSWDKYKLTKLLM